MTATQPDNLVRLQTTRKLVLFLGILAVLGALAVSVPRWPVESGFHEAVELAGLVLIAICIAGRTWASLYIGGRKTTELVTTGPYSIMRNPLYSFTFLGAAGVGLQFGAIMMAVLSALFVYLTFAFVVSREEAFLQARFGAAYEDYLARVPRFFPNTRLWHAPSMIEVDPRLVWRTFRDALAFLLAIPLLELIEEAHVSDLLPTIFMLY